MESIYDFLMFHRFYVGLGIGVCLGTMLGILALALCFVSGKADDEMEEFYVQNKLKRHRD